MNFRIFICLTKTKWGRYEVARSNDLKILPSKVILCDESVVLFDELNEKEKLEIQSHICENISKCISNYYSSKREEWDNFVSAVN